MPERALPDWIESYLEYTDNSEPPVSFRRWTAIAVIAAALQRKCRLSWGTLTFFPNMYIVLVAPSGRARKGTAMGPGLKLLEDLGVNLAAEAVTREALIRALKESEAMHQNEQGGIEYHSSLTIYSPELAVFLGYKNEQLLSDLTDWYDCRRRWTYRTKTQGTDEIARIWVNLFGATTPSLLQTTLPMNAIGGGLTSRMIFVYEQDKGKTVPTPFPTRREKELEELLKRDLERINLMHGVFKPTQAFVEHWAEWYMVADQNQPFNDERLAGYCERRPNHIMKLAMIISASRRDDMIVDLDDLKEAIVILEEVERKMPNALGGVGRSPIVSLVSGILRFIGHRKKVNLRTLHGTFYFDASPHELKEAISQLTSMRFIKHDVVSDTLSITPEGQQYLGGKDE